MEAIQEKFHNGETTTREAFEELCAMVHNINSEREERREAVKAKMGLLRQRNRRLRERNVRLRGKYAAMVDKYNELAAEAKDRSDSSSSSDDSDGNDDCCIM